MEVCECLILALSRVGLVQVVGSTDSPIVESNALRICVRQLPTRGSKGIWEMTEVGLS
jgi:hypothetical protein